MAERRGRQFRKDQGQVNWTQCKMPVAEATEEDWGDAYSQTEQNVKKTSVTQLAQDDWNKRTSQQFSSEECQKTNASKAYNTKQYNTNEEHDEFDAWDSNSYSGYSYSPQSVSATNFRVETKTFSRSHDINDRSNYRGRAAMQEDFGRQEVVIGGKIDSVDTVEKEEKFKDCMEIKIPSKLIGLVIGKGGSKIRELQERSSARINIDKNCVDSSGMISVMIHGSSSAQYDAKKLIEELCDSQAWSKDRGNESQFTDNETGHDVLKMAIPSQFVGKIIGKGGCMINDLQIASDAKIKVARDNTGPTSVITIFGNEEARKRALELINELISDQNNSRNNSRYENTTHDSSLIGASDAYQADTYQSRCLDDHTTSQVPTRSEHSGGDTSFGRMKDFGRSHNWNHGNGTTVGTSECRKLDASSKNSGTNNEGGGAAETGLIDWDKIREGNKTYQQIKWKDYPPVVKDFYIEDEKVANLEPYETDKIRKENNNIMVQHLDGSDGGHIPNPIRTFGEAFSHYPEIMQEIKKAGFEKPSPIQMQAWPIILQGHDLIGIAQTGTGKTLAFLLPAFIHIEGQPADRDKRGGANVLVLTPTRELALQIEEEVKKYRYKDIKCVCLYGGGSRKEQINVVTSGVEIIVATPGRLIDLISNKIVDVKSVTYLILDEADRMLDMGFQPDIRKILLDIRPERQTIMTSATWPVGVRYMATNYMNKPIQVFVGSMDLTACHSVLQRVIMVDEDAKLEKLMELLDSEIGEEEKVIVFMGRKSTVDYVSTQFIMREIECQSIHGGREQLDREQALDDLKNGSVRILLATDVASRGIDIKDVTHVINYDFPHNIEEYVHRVGRTGRAGRYGQSITFMARNDWRYAQSLIEIMEEAKQQVPQALLDMAARFAANQERRRLEGGTSGRTFRKPGGNFGDDFGGFHSGQGGRRGRKDNMGFSLD